MIVSYDDVAIWVEIINYEYPSQDLVDWLFHNKCTEVALNILVAIYLYKFDYHFH